MNINRRSFGGRKLTKLDLMGIRFLDADEIEGATPDPETPDAEAYEAKIAELTGIIAERDASIADLGLQLTAAKAHNYDLLVSVPTDVDPVETDVEVDDNDVDFDDFFGKDDE